MRDDVADTLYAFGWNATARLPERVARANFDAIADATWLRGGRSVVQLRTNLARVVPDLDDGALSQLTRAGMRSYMRYWCEAFRLASMDAGDIVRRMHVIDEPRLRDAVASGRGVVLALPHMGNWDHAGAWLTATGVPFTTVAERLRPESLFDRFVAYRESLGMEVVPLTGGQRPPYGLLADRLRSGGVLCLLADRDLTATGIEVEFFGKGARFPAGPAALAFDTGAALLPVTLAYPTRRTWQGRIHPAVRPDGAGDRACQVATMTQRVADAFAGAIAERPQDWHMVQRVWTDDLDPARLPVA